MTLRQGLIKINKKSPSIRDSRNDGTNNNDTLADVYDGLSNRTGNQSFRNRKYGASPRIISNNNSHRSNKINESMEYNESLKLPSVINENHFLRKSLEAARYSKDEASRNREYSVNNS